MKRVLSCSVVVCLMFSAAELLLAQEQVVPPPKVLMIYREFLKPGKAGTAHEKAEAAFVNAVISAKSSQHYLAMDSLTGQPRSLFFFGYDSFEAIEKDNMATQKNAVLSSALDRASAADGDLLASQEGTAFVYNEEQSFHAPVEIAKMRYMEIYRFSVKPGHDKEWEALVNLYHNAYDKALPDSHWAVYDAWFGRNSGGSHVLLVPMKSLSEIDKSFGEDKKVEAALGEDGQKKAAELQAACVQESEVNVFAFNPRESYLDEAWVQADPTFWKAKTNFAAKKTETKTAVGQ
jgi:hypothetical protein